MHLRAFIAEPIARDSKSIALRAAPCSSRDLARERPRMICEQEVLAIQC